MSLYYILFDHYSQRDSERGVVAIVAADSEEQIFDWIAGGAKVQLPHSIVSNWADRVKNNPSFKTEIIESGGEMFWHGLELTDLYYGKTVYGWIKFDGIVENFRGLDIFFDLTYKA